MSSSSSSSSSSLTIDSSSEDDSYWTYFFGKPKPTAEELLREKLARQEAERLQKEKEKAKHPWGRTKKALIWTALFMFVSSFLTLAYEVLSSTDADVQNHSYKDADTYNIAPNSIKGSTQLAAEARKMRQSVYNVEEIEIYPHLAANHTKELHKPDTDPAELLWKQFSKHKEVVLDRLSKAETNGEPSPAQAVVNAAVARGESDGAIPHSAVPSTRMRRLRSRQSEIEEKLKFHFGHIENT